MLINPKTSCLCQKMNLRVGDKLMETMIHSKSFSAARVSLPKEISSKVGKALLQLYDDKRSVGLHQEKIYDDVYSARVDDTYRIIYTKTDGLVVLMYVGLHDDAYNWAKKHSLKVNEFIGTLQIIENIPPKTGRDPKSKKRISRLAILTNEQMKIFGIPEEWWVTLRTKVFIKENLLPFKQVLSEATILVLEELLDGDTDMDGLIDFYKDISTPQKALVLQKKIEETPLYSNFTDEELIRVGIPAEYLDLIRSIKDEEDLKRIEIKLPDIIVQSLYALKSGISVEEIYKTTFADSRPIKEKDLDAALKNPVTLAEFVPVPDKEALAAMMEFPMEQWRVFLHPAQRRLVEHDYAGPARIIGGAGTGKTVVIVHRARYLARKCESNRKVLVTTYGRTLAEDIHARLRMICSQEELEKIYVTTVDGLTKRIAEALGFTIIYEREKNREGFSNLSYIWFNLIGGLQIPGITPDFFMEEWQDVIQAQNIKSLEEYCEARRESRGKKLERKIRERIWPIFESYRNECIYRNIADVDFAQNRCAEYLTGNSLSTQYAYILVDECQDLRAPAFRLLRAVAGKQHENDLYFSGDSRQRIYNRKVSLSQCGVFVKNRSTELKINY